MADGIEVKVDASRGLVRLTRITPAVRDDLRGVIPGLTNRVALLISAKLGSELKSRTSLHVAREMHETTNQLYGVARLESPSANGLLPEYLEKGTPPHGIAGNPILAFPWDFMGAYGASVSGNTTMAFFRRVSHPGTRAYRFVGRSFDEMEKIIVDELTRAVGAAAKKGLNMAVYEPIMDALLAYLQAQTAFGTTSATFLTMQRGIVMWERLAEIVNGNPVIRQPALFLYDGPEFGGGVIDYSRPGGRATPPVRLLRRTIVIYARTNVAGGFPGGYIGGLAAQNIVTSQASFLHPLIEAVETALNTPDNPETGTLTLNGLVAYCRHEGRGFQIPPDIDPNGQGMASLPIEIKVP